MTPPLNFLECAIKLKHRSKEFEHKNAKIKF